MPRTARWPGSAAATVCVSRSVAALDAMCPQGCPFCDEHFAYHPDAFHKHFTCSNEECAKSFGIRLYTTGPRIEAALRQELRERAGGKAAKREADAARQQRRPLQLPAEQSAALAEMAFEGCLLDTCPRCGAEDVEEKSEKRWDHLLHCNDAKAHAAYARLKAERASKLAQTASRQVSQEEVEGLAAWRYLGSSAATAWMLTDTQLESECERRGLVLTDRSSREDKLAGLAKKEKTALIATSKEFQALPVGQLREKLSAKGLDASGAKGVLVERLVQAAATAQQPTAREEMPSNLHALSLSMLKQLCASQGVVIPAGSSKDAVIVLLEKHSGAMDDADAKDLEKVEAREEAREEVEDGDAEVEAEGGDEDEA